MISPQDLDRAVEAGIISAEQRVALLALGPPPGSPPSPPGDAGRRGFNAMNIAYWTGGIAVLVAFAWILIARWTVLGAGGVLVVTTTYSAVFALTAHTLQRYGYHTAARVVTVLLVGMAPIVTWSLLTLFGQWNPYPPYRGDMAAPFTSDWNDLRWLPIDLATILASLIALRRVHYGVLGLPLALACAALGVHALPLVLDQALIRAMDGGLTLFLAVLLLAVGYAVDQRTTANEDYATWFYAVGLAALLPSMFYYWERSRLLTAHTTLSVSVMFAYAALRLRRRLFLVASLIGFLAYLTYLTFDVFKTDVGYPIVLATVGLATILLAVWVQRRFPTIVQRMDRAARQPIPAAALILAGMVLISLTLVVTDVAEARQRIADQYWRETVGRLMAHNARVHGSGTRLARGPVPRAPH
jgi:hypothetical protein